MKGEWNICLKHEDAEAETLAEGEIVGNFGVREKQIDHIPTGRRFCFLIASEEKGIGFCKELQELSDWSSAVREDYKIDELFAALMLAAATVNSEMLKIGGYLNLVDNDLLGDMEEVMKG